MQHATRSTSHASRHALTQKANTGHCSSGRRCLGRWHAHGGCGGGEEADGQGRLPHAGRQVAEPLPHACTCAWSVQHAQTRMEVQSGGESDGQTHPGCQPGPTPPHPAHYQAPMHAGLCGSMTTAMSPSLHAAASTCPSPAQTLWRRCEDEVERGRAGGVEPLLRLARYVPSIICVGANISRAQTCMHLHAMQFKHPVMLPPHISAQQGCLVGYLCWCTMQVTSQVPNRAADLIVVSLGARHRHGMGMRQTDKPPLLRCLLMEGRCQLGLWSCCQLHPAYTQHYACIGPAPTAHTHACIAHAGVRRWRPGVCGGHGAAERRGVHGAAAAAGRLRRVDHGGWEPASWRCMDAVQHTSSTKQCSICIIMHVRHHAS